MARYQQPGAHVGGTIWSSRGAQHQVYAVAKWFAPYGRSPQGRLIHRVRYVHVYFDPLWFGERSGWPKAARVVATWLCGNSSNSAQLLLAVPANWSICQRCEITHNLKGGRPWEAHRER